MLRRLWWDLADWLYVLLLALLVALPGLVRLTFGHSDDPTISPR